jgi:hypothetical protein
MYCRWWITRAWGTGQVGGEKTTYTYWSKTARISNEAAVELLRRPFNLIAPIEIAPGGSEGAIIAQGGRFGGWALFVHDGRLVYEHNYLGIERFRVTSPAPLPEGKVKVGMTLRLNGKFDISPALTTLGMQGDTGVVGPFVNDQKVAEGLLPKMVPFTWSLTGDGLCIGFDSESPVSDLYKWPGTSTGKIERVVISPQAAPFENFFKEVEKGILTD